MGQIEPYPGMELTEELRAAVTCEERLVPGPEGAPEIRVLLYRPRGAHGALPLVMSFHGGAFAMRPDHFPANDARLARLGALVVSVDYRIVPDHPFPAGVEDCAPGQHHGRSDDRRTQAQAGALLLGAVAAAIAPRQS